MTAQPPGTNGKLVVNVENSTTGTEQVYTVNPDGPGKLRELGNTDIVTVGPNDIVRIASSGGGGWGSPLEREPDRVLRDVTDGLISVEAALTQYGVVLSADHSEVDQAGTVARRAALNGREA